MCLIVFLLWVSGICSSFVLGICIFLSDLVFLQMGSVGNGHSRPKLAATLFFCSVFSVAFL